MTSNLDGVLFCLPPDYGAAVVALLAAVERLSACMFANAGRHAHKFGGAILPMFICTPPTAEWLPPRAWRSRPRLGRHRAHVGRVHRVALQRRSHGPMAAVDLPSTRAATMEAVIVVDADEGRRQAMVSELRSRWRPSTTAPPLPAQ